MNKIHGILIVIAVSIPIAVLMIIGQHDLNIQQQYVDGLEVQFYHQVNNTASCPDLKDWIASGNLLCHHQI